MVQLWRIAGNARAGEGESGRRAGRAECTFEDFRHAGARRAEHDLFGWILEIVQCGFGRVVITDAGVVASPSCRWQLLAEVAAEILPVHVNVVLVARIHTSRPLWFFLA
jgi:hypothetical protein